MCDNKDGGVFMISSDDAQKILTDYHVLNENVKRFHLKIGFSIIALLVLITLFLGFGLFHSHANVQSLVFSVGFVLLIILLVLMLHTFKDYAPNQPKYTLLYPEIYHALNKEHPKLFTIDKDMTNHLDVHRQSQLFAHVIRPYRIIKTTTPEKHALTIYDMQIYRPTQRTTIKQFQGTYIRLELKTPFTFQIRTEGRPSKGDIEYYKGKSIGPYQLYLTDKEMPNETISRFIEAIEDFVRDHPIDAFSLSVTPKEIAIAFSPTIIPKITPPFKEEAIHRLGEFFYNERDSLSGFVKRIP